jgi:ubiquinone/menaquinone biosynthesis C-methylase UbiE
MADQAYHHSLTNHTPDNYNKHADFVYSAKNTAPIFELLEAKPGERIIDLGCGTGELTEIIREAVGDAGEVWGVDSSESMVSEQKPSYLNLPRS